MNYNLYWLSGLIVKTLLFMLWPLMQLLHLIVNAYDIEIYSIVPGEHSTLSTVKYLKSLIVRTPLVVPSLIAGLFVKRAGESIYT